jgi:UrcA family protein
MDCIADPARETTMNTLINGYRSAQVLAIAAVVGTLLAQSAIAASPPSEEEPAKTQVVQLADLNLESSAGVAKAYQRIRNAAERVCRPAFNSETATVKRLRKLCGTDAVAHAVANVNSPALTNYHLVKTQGVTVPTVAGRN